MFFRSFSALVFSLSRTYFKASLLILCFYRGLQVLPAASSVLLSQNFSLQSLRGC